MAEFHPDLLEPLLATVARTLASRSAVTEASVVANSRPSLSQDKREWSRYNWTIRLALPYEVYANLGFEREPHVNDPVSTPREEVEAAINDAVEFVSKSRWDDRFQTKIIVALDEDPEWRTQVRRQLSGEDINNQGRVHSRNVAARQHDNLLFRSGPEVLFYEAIKAQMVPFAPLPVVVTGRQEENRKRIEPDFVIFKSPSGKELSRQSRL